LTASLLVACNHDDDVVPVDDQAAVTAALSADPGSINLGEASQLTWGSTNASQCAGDGFDTRDATSGDAIVSPVETTTYSVTCDGEPGSDPATATATVMVLSDPNVSPSLDQAAFQASSETYLFGFNSIPNIPIKDAPNDADFTRMAILHDGSNYRLYAMQSGSNSIIYQFVFDPGATAYTYGLPGQLNQIDIVGVDTQPDADPGSIAMLHDGSSYRLYMRSLSDPGLLHQFVFNAGTNDYEYGFGGVSQVIVSGAPADADHNRWAMLHDGSIARFYLGQMGNLNTLYQFGLNAASGEFEYAFDSITPIDIVGTPTTSVTDDFIMLHDGGIYRFYYYAPIKAPPPPPPGDPDDLGQYMSSAYSCIQRQDANHFLFHGCFDWHSAVHGHWAVLRYGNVVGRTMEVENTIARLQSSALADERTFMNGSPNFEMPYGRAWFLALALEYERLVGDAQMAPMAADMAASLRTFLSSRTIDPLIREYQNHTWALAQLLRYYRARGDIDGVNWVVAQVDANYLVYDAGAALLLDQTRPDFFSLWGNWAMLLGLRDPNALVQWLAQQTITDAALEPIRNANSSHQLGINPSRAWGLWWAHAATGDARLEQAIAAHGQEMADTHQERQADYGAYGHWVPQFVMYASTQPVE
jgi:hypothetical protein